jgi:hypothetical protein
VAVVVALPEPADQPNPVDRIRGILNSLVLERQALRHSGTDQSALEANRLAIVYWQQEFSQHLIESSASVAPRAESWPFGRFPPGSPSSA